jgi:hypothetical protein
MAELSSEDKVSLSQISGDMMTLLLLDDAWTEAAQRRSVASGFPASPLPVGHPTSPIAITNETCVPQVRIGFVTRSGASLQVRVWRDGDGDPDAIVTRFAR